MAKLGRHAIVIGASIGGLLAASALAEHYGEVTILERDALPEAAEPRKGVPQGRHAHGLLARGREVLEQLFPGFTDELLARGALRGDVVDEVRWFNYGVYLHSAPSTLVGLLVSRPALEETVRGRVCRLPNVRVLAQTVASEPVSDPDEGRIAGLRVEPTVGSTGARTISADLVVDASGRGSRSSAWLDAIGYAKPREQSIAVDIGYMTRLYRRRPEHLDGKKAAVLAACRPDWRTGVILAQENDRWIVSLGGYFGDYAPADDAGYLEFARSLQKPDVFEVIRNAEPLSPIAPYHFGANLRRHYEELSRFPRGYLVFGDALCSFNPVYGQGMTVACLEALALQECLREGSDGIARRFFRVAGRLIDIPWQIAVGSDLRHPRVEGKRTAQTRFVNWYLDRLFQVAQRDAALATRFLEVANLTRPPAALMQPATMLRVWKGGRASG